jgi:DNA-binding XRE family transcriptional regulator
MLVAAKKHLTEISFGARKPQIFLVPTAKAHGILRLIEEYRVDNDDELVDAQDSFKDLNKKYTKAGALLQGFRLRDEMTQTQLAKKLGTSQPAVAAMESGDRPIGKTTAKKLGKIFDTDYRNFL